MWLHCGVPQRHCPRAADLKHAHACRSRSAAVTMSEAQLPRRLPEAAVDKQRAGFAGASPQHRAFCSGWLSEHPIASALAKAAHNQASLACGVLKQPRACSTTPRSVPHQQLVAGLLQLTPRDTP